MTTPKPPATAEFAFRQKKMVVKTALVALGAGFELLSKMSPEMVDEIRDWPEGRTLMLGVLPDGPSITVRKRNGRLVLLGSGDLGAEIKILFKNVDSAFLVMSAQIGSHTAFAEHRAIVHGSLREVMEVNRALALVLKYLFPSVLLKRVTKRMPGFTRKQLVVKAKLYALIGPALATGLFK